MRGHCDSEGLSFTAFRQIRNAFHDRYIPSFLVRILGAWNVKVFRLSIRLSLVLGGSSINAGRTRLASISCLALACTLS